MANSLRIGSVLKKLRLEKGLTLQQLADMASVTAAYISKLENEKVSPSIQTLHKIAEALKVSIIEFFENDLIDDPCINPPESWTKKLVKGWKADVRQMVKLVGNKKMQPFFTTIPPKGGAHDHYTHPGEEFVYVLEGRLTLTLNGETIELKSGTLAYFSALVAHTWVNNGEVPVKMIWVCSPPSW
ncbi:MAG: XRE family transcriptional regulator [Candidatus Adiutrix sp.]|jgi:transcriptional regulator with XRE-family HTH domain|nr:XRE family transcriptional regulator [Candidatus Adiutrix sp.]